MGLISLIVFVSLLIRIIMLDTIPPNITGDEVTNLSDVYRILFGKEYHIFSFMGDGSVAGINFYLSAFLAKMFELRNTIFSLRFPIVLLSIFSLIPFYFLLVNKTSRLIGGGFTLLLSTNYTFLNFSRTAWINMGVIFSGLSLLLLLEKAEREKREIWYVLAGVFAGITLYGYHYGKILVGSIILYLLLTFLYNKNRNLAYIKKISIFLGITLIVSLPLLLTIIFDRAESVLRRPRNVYAFSSNRTADLSPTQNLLQHQIEYTLKGFIILDSNVMSEGVENQRYLPIHTSPVNLPIKILFILGLVYAIFFSRGLRFWWILFFTILLTQIVTELPPNFSRGLFYIPFIYFISGMFFSKICSFSKKLLIGKYYIMFAFIFVFAIAVLSLADIRTYFDWMQSKDIYNSRQPAIDYREFSIWQTYQIQRVKNGQTPVNNYEWDEIRKTLPLK